MLHKISKKGKTAVKLGKIAKHVKTKYYSFTKYINSDDKQQRFDQQGLYQANEQTGVTN